MYLMAVVTSYLADRKLCTSEMSTFQLCLHKQLYSIWPRWHRMSCMAFVPKNLSLSLWCWLRARIGGQIHVIVTRWQQQQAALMRDTVLSPVRTGGLNVCTPGWCLISATIGQRWGRFGEDGGGQGSPHRRQKHPPWCSKKIKKSHPKYRCSQIWTSSLRSKHSRALPCTPMLQLTTRHRKVGLCTHRL